MSHTGATQQRSEDTIRPFQATFPDAELTELRRRINATKWPERETVADATQGVQLTTIQALARYWGTEYDWRKCEAKLNSLPQFITEIDGLDIHFIHVRSKHENALPLIVTHGWPGSVVEQLKIIDPLTNPTAHGGSASDAFDVVIPSMPGYGYSGKPTKAAERPEVLGLWRDFVLRLSSAPVVSIAKIRGRARGIGNEFVLACDMRFASRQSAVFGNPEVGVGLVPGGGGMEWLPRLVGRSRALEIVLSGDDFDADIAERYGWVNRALDDANLDSFVDTLVRRLASFDRETLAAAKAQINRFGTPTAAEIQSSIDLFFPLLALPGAQARRAKIRNVGYGVPSDFELNFGRYLPGFGKADDDDTDKQPD